MQKQEREYRRLFERYGLKVLDVSVSGSGVLSPVVLAPNGEARRFFFSTSPDSHGLKNNERDIRRFAEENLETATAAALKKVLPAPRTEIGAPLTPVTVSPPPAVTPASTQEPRMTEAKIPQQRISRKDFIRVYEWMKTADLTGCFTNVELLRRAQKVFEGQFTVTADSIHDALDMSDVKLPERPIKPPVSTQGHDRARAVARYVLYLYEKLGEPVPDDLRAIANGASISSKSSAQTELLP